MATDTRFTTTIPATHLPARAYLLVFMLFLFQTLNFFDKLAFGVSAVSIMHQLGLSPKQFGLIGASFFLFFAIGGTIVGLFLVGRFSTKWILFGMAAVWTVAQLPIFFSTSIPVIVGARLLLGLGEGAALATALTSAYEWFPEQRRNLPSAVILQGISAGFLIGGPLLTYFVVNDGWQSCFLVCAILSLVWMVLWAVIARTGPLTATTMAARASAHMPAIPARVLWLDRTVIGVVIIAFCGYWVIGMSAVWLPPYLRLALGYAPVRAGWIISVIYVLQSPVLLGGAWATQMMRVRGWSARICLGLTSALAMLVAGVAMIAAVRAPLGGVQIALLAVGFSVPSLTTIFGPVLLAAIAPPVDRARLVVVIISATSISAFCSTYFNGYVIGQYPGNAPAGFAAAFTCGGIVLLAGAVAGLILIHPERTLARFADRSAPGAHAVPAFNRAAQ
jgi:predicted MFS family arabinose efflux permease